ncbi:MAG: caspase family protein, partial [Cyclobacteriaceae bacterium]|nr:caspase family protein [Cyclobacteriaceae bacterium]
FLRLVDLDSKKSSSRLFHLQSVVGDVCFMDDSTFVSTDHDKLILWRFYRDEIKHLYQKIISLPRPVVKQARLADGKLLLLGREGHISYYDHLAGTVINTDFNNTEDIFGLGTGRAVATTKDNTMYLLKEQDGAIISEAVFRGHQDRVTSVTMTPDNRLLFSSSLDASVKIWNIDSARLAMTVVPVGKNNALYVTPDNYYMTTGKSLLDFGFKVDDRFVFPEQFDALYNRPDIIMERLGYAPAPLVLAYKKAWEKRLEKLGIEESMLKKDFHLPELELLNAVAIPAESLSDTLLLKLKLKDSVYTLDRVNVWVNNVPVFGRKGLAVTKKNTDALYLDVPVKLVKGNNKVQMNVMNTAGAESFIESVEIKCMTGPQQANLYFVAMGVSEYKDPFYNLNYARKDGEDMESLMLENKNSFDQVHTLTLFDQQVTKEKLKEVRQFLMSSKENDQIIFFVSGHGLLNENYDFFFATHDTDFKDPAGRGIAYDMLDDLLDSLPARKKLLLLDACHSGEVDKEIAEPEGGVMIVQKDEETEEIKEYSFRGGSGGRLDDGLGLSSSFELMQELFANLNRGSGTVVLAAAAGNSFAREGPAWQNGVFTYCLRNALGDNKNKKMYADQNRDGKVTMVELQSYVAGEVSRLTNGKQKPVVRNENTAVEMIVR